MVQQGCQRLTVALSPCHLPAEIGNTGLFPPDWDEPEPFPKSRLNPGGRS